jgi:predicted Rossmann fold nucleotide-binding protein DprA/Smf involved in DNA uptake
MSTYTDDLVVRINERIAVLLDEVDRLQAARTALVGTPPASALAPETVARHTRKHREAHDKLATVVRLPRAPRKAPIDGVASADDVLALVATGVDTATSVANHLQVRMASVRRRLIELRQQGMVVRSDNATWQATTEAQGLNWIENRARELA